MSEIRFNRWSHQSGTGGIYQDSSGNIGIGTSTPTSVLDIQGGSIKIGNDLLTSSGVSTFTSGLNVTSGSVGIGTDNPRTKLDVRGGNWSNGDIVVGQIGNAGRINFRRGVDGGDTAYLGYDGATNNSQVALAVNSGDGTILFKTNSTERLRIKSDGNIGIGTNNPGLPLDVVADSTSETVRFRGYSTGDQTGTLRFTSNDGATNYSYIQSRSTFFKLGSTPDIPVIITANSKEIVRVEDNSVHIGERTGNNNTTNFGTSRVTICGPAGIGITVTKANSYLAIGNNESTLNGVYPITFGYTKNTYDYQPAYIAYKTINSGAAEYGDLIFGTRNVITDTLPSERLRITSDGTLRQTGESNTLGQGTSVAKLTHYTIDPTTPGGVGDVTTLETTSTTSNGSDYKFRITKREGSGGGSCYFDLGGNSDGSISFGTNTSGSGTERLRIDSSGRVTMPYQPACKMVIDSNGTIASGSGPADTGRTIVPFNSTGYGGFNTGSHFNTSNHTFTCPVDGRYLVISSVNVIGDNIQYIYINGSPRAAGEFRSNPTTVWEHNEISGVFDLNANDTITAFSQLTGSGRKWNGGSGGSYWDTLSIYLVG